MKTSQFLVGILLAAMLPIISAQMSHEGNGMDVVVVAADSGNEIPAEDSSSAVDEEDDQAPAECGECDPTTCPPAPTCRAGYQNDACGCCSVCAASSGEKCDADPAVYKYGVCGDNLECRPRADIVSPSQVEMTCQCTDNKLVCGSDGQTYENICELRGAANMLRPALKEGANDTLTVSLWGPCDEEPRITSQPEEARVEQGGNVALACEAKGWPVPVITWETIRADGSQFILPSDHTTIAVQQRGGPERLMVSGWVQLMDVQPSDGGVYTCVAKNKLGEARFSAEVGVYKETAEQVGSNDNQV